MMQFVAPAQLFLVLWLFAATAPAATALVNGSLAVLIDAQPIDLRAPSSSRESEESATIDAARGISIELHGKTDVAQIILLALAQDDTLVFDAACESETFLGFHEAPVALSSSVLHTGVQRHRPRSA